MFRKTSGGFGKTSQDSSPADWWNFRRKFAKLPTLVNILWNVGFLYARLAIQSYGILFMGDV